MAPSGPHLGRCPSQHPPGSRRRPRGSTADPGSGAHRSPPPAGSPASDPGGQMGRCGNAVAAADHTTAVWAHAGKPPVPILTWWLRRGPRAVTRADARAPLGRETQRPWPAPAMARTTPAWVSLSASLTLTAPPLRQQEVPTVRLTAWSANLHPTCAQTMAWVRRHGWEPGRCSTSSQGSGQAHRATCGG